MEFWSQEALGLNPSSVTLSSTFSSSPEPQIGELWKGFSELTFGYLVSGLLWVLTGCVSSPAWALSPHQGPHYHN